MHLIPTINPHWRAISFNRFLGMVNSIPQNQDTTFKPERWYVMSQCEQQIFSVVIYFCQFDKCIQYHAVAVQ